MSGPHAELSPRERAEVEYLRQLADGRLRAYEEIRAQLQDAIAKLPPCPHCRVPWDASTYFRRYPRPMMDSP